MTLNLDPLKPRREVDEALPPDNRSLGFGRLGYSLDDAMGVIY